VHWDALRSAPRAWLVAMGWRICGKRLRARLMMAPLLGRSRWAYPLWLAQGGGDDRLCRTKELARANLLALVEAGEGQERTLSSLAAQGIPALLVVSDDVPRLGQAVADALGPDAGGVWLLPLAAGDTLAECAGVLYRAAVAGADPETRVVYADDDLIDARGRRKDPHFKPDWNAELYRHFDFVAGAAILRASEQELEDLPTVGWVAELARRIVANGHAQDGATVHLRRILHHRRARPTPRRPEQGASVEPGAGALPSVSIIIPTRNRLDLLRPCLEGLARTDYPGPVEIIVIDNDSDDAATLAYLAGLDPASVRVLRHPGAFNFAAMNNRAVEDAAGELLCFLNNDIEICEPNWLATMATQALRTEVGAVGACLLYPDGRIQHAGVVLGIGGGAAHAHRLLRPEDMGYFHRHALPQFVSAVTAACLVVRRDRFLAVGGFDAESFSVAFNDVDLCLKLNARGWQSLYEPRATLVHHESVSRGLDRDPVGSARLARELAALQQRWSIAPAPGATAANPAQAVDPFHHPELSPFSEHFVVRL
jgi:GT2 family glycosyltransferase